MLAKHMSMAWRHRAFAAAGACRCHPCQRIMTTVVTLKEIQLRDAKATLSAVIDDAVRGAPCVITRHGRREAVLIAYEEWKRLSQVPSFGRMLMAAPLEEGDLPRRNRKPLRRTRL